MIEDICNYLSNIRKLDKKEYNFLVSKYGFSAVNSAIERMIDEDEENISKFDYYVSRVEISIDDVSSLSSVEFYFKDMNSISRLSSEENRKYSREAYEIVCELNIILDSFESNYSIDICMGLVSIIDKIEYILSNCQDIVLLNKIKTLYKKFLEIRNKLVNGNLKLVLAVAKTVGKKDVPLLDLIQYGNMGLMKAVEKYNPNFNTSFSTYAYYWIKQVINRYSKVDLAVSSSVSYGSVNLNNTRIKVINELTNQLGRNPTREEILTYMNIDEERLNELEIAFDCNVSIDAEISEDGKSTRFIDMVCDENTNIEDEVCDRELYPELMRLMNQFLNDKQIFILTKRYGMDGPSMTLQEVGDILGITRERTRQLEDKALARLKTFGKNSLMGFRG